MLPGGATVPGRALIDTLPLVSQIVMVLVLWQVGRASAVGALTSPRPATPATNQVDTFGQLISPASQPFSANDFREVYAPPPADHVAAVPWGMCNSRALLDALEPMPERTAIRISLTLYKQISGGQGGCESGQRVLGRPAR